MDEAMRQGVQAARNRVPCRLPADRVLLADVLDVGGLADVLDRDDMCCRGLADVLDRKLGPTVRPERDGDTEANNESNTS